MSFSQHALQEILANIKCRDLIKAHLVLDHFDQLPEDEQRRILFELNKIDDELALPLLIQLDSQNNSTSKRFPTIRETIISKALNSPGVIGRYLGEKSQRQSYYVELAGDLRLQSTTAELIQVLLNSSDLEVLQSVITVLGKIGDAEAVNAVSEYLYVDNKNLVSAAIQALGQIGTSTAMQRLSERLGADEDIATAVIDVFFHVQDDLSISKLNEALQSRSAHIRNYVKTKLSILGSKAVPTISANLDANDADLQIHSLNILQNIGDESAALAVRKLLNTHPRNANVRFAAYEALSVLSGQKGDYVLAGGLEDQDSNVRMAAARAIDNNLDSILVAGIRNMINPGSKVSEDFVRTLIDVKASRIFTALINDQNFQTMAFEYLAGHVHPEILNYFVQILLTEENAGLANTLLRQAKNVTRAKGGMMIWAVDDSKMILNVYRKVLTELGYECTLFSEPQKALEALSSEKPDFLFTDLNMPEITGVELISKIRENISKNELPIIMVTTQNEVQDNRAALDAGVNQIIDKPFNAAKLKAAIERVE